MTDGGARIQLCGRLVVNVGGRPIEALLPGRQGRLLFVHLVLNRHRSLSRFALVDALWEDEPPDGSDGALSALLSKLRRLLGDTAIQGRGEVRIALPEDTWVDLEAATEALHRAESLLARGEHAAAWGPARVAQHIAARGFLPAEHAGWVEEVRQRLEAVHERSLEVAATASLSIGGSELSTAERSARTLVSIAPYSERAYRLLMEALVARGERARALLAYDELLRRLRADLGTTPSPEMQAFHRSLLE